MKAEYARLKHTLTIVTRERDLAVKEKHQLQAKLENLEQVLKVGLTSTSAFHGGQREEGGAAEFQSREWLKLLLSFKIIKIQGSMGLFLPFLWYTKQ